MCHSLCDVLSLCTCIDNKSQVTILMQFLHHYYIYIYLVLCAYVCVCVCAYVAVCVCVCVMKNEKLPLLLPPPFENNRQIDLSIPRSQSTWTQLYRTVNNQGMKLDVFVQVPIYHHWARVYNHWNGVLYPTVGQGCKENTFTLKLHVDK